MTPPSLPAAAPPAAPPAATARFAATRSRILDAASTLINERGVKGLSLAEVADKVGLGNTSVTYYFKRKDELAAACFDRALDQLEAQVTKAGAEPDLRARIRRLVALNFTALEEIERGIARPTVRLSDLRANEDPMRGELVARFFAIFRMARAFFGEGGSEEDRLLRLMRTHVLLDNMFMLPSWLDQYGVEEYDRVRFRLVELLERGIAPGWARWNPIPVILSDDSADTAQDRFLGAATRLINERGYRGASVEQISSQLNVTKGSFYHHHDAKDDLVLACFQRSLATVSAAQDAALAVEGSRLDRVVSAVAALLEMQLTDRAPLLRSTALLALPGELRAEVVDRSNRITRRFAGMIIDGITEGSIPPVDPVIAGQVLMAALNAAYELRERAARVPLDRAILLYGSTLLHGLLSVRGPAAEDHLTANRIHT